MVCSNEQALFVPPIHVSTTHIGFSTCPNSLQPLHNRADTTFHPYRRLHASRASRHHPSARISNGLPAYRAALLTRRHTDTAPTLHSKSTTLADLQAAAPQKTETKRPGKLPEEDIRYRVRMAEDRELYTVADIRCDAFYGYPKDPYYYPVRRREIYMAMRDRIDAGNKCLVVVDTQPPEDWESFANNGELVVGSLDVSLHTASSGRRCRFGSGRVETEQDGRRIYISSMAVRDEWQRRGLAQRLLRHVDVTARLHGINDIFLHVEWENAPAVHVYLKSGFVCVEEDSRIPRWLHFLAKREHTLMRKSLE